MPNANEKMNWMPNSNKLYYTVMGESNDLVVFDPATMREVLLKNVPEDGWLVSYRKLSYLYAHGRGRKGVEVAR